MLNSKRSKSVVLDIDGRTFRSISPISVYTGLMIACRVDVMGKRVTNIVCVQGETFCDSCYIHALKVLNGA